MQTRIIGLIALCASVAACNSKTPEATETPTEAATPAASTPTAPAAPPAAMQPAPEGLPSRVAREAITAAGLTCDVAKADRNAQDGTVVASCVSGESYRIHSVEGRAVATRL